MTERSALKAALGLLHLPASVRLVRSEPLPPGIETVLRIAAGDDAAETEAARLTERPRPVIREAAAFYIEQVLLCPASDSYRVLGTTSAASPHELRRNMALLLSWLHPDKNASGERAVLAARVTGAWNDLRSPDRRAAYDAALAQSHDSSRRSAPQDKIARTGPGNGNRNRNGKVQTTRAKTAKAKNPDGPPHRRSVGLFANEHQSLLRRGWHSLRRLLRDRSTP